MMIATAVAMLRGRRNVDPSTTPRELPVGRVLVDGVLVGLVTGLVGAGGPSGGAAGACGGPPAGGCCAGTEKLSPGAAGVVTT